MTSSQILKTIVCISAVFLLGFSVPSSAAEPASGWRGNGTGLWPDAKPTLHWQRIPHGAMEGLRAQANRPVGKDAGDAVLVEKGLLRDWLVLGPFAVTDSVRDFETDSLNGEDKIEPTNGEETSGRTWLSATVPADDPMIFGNAELPWLDLVKVIGFELNRLAYAHTYVYSPRGGKVRMVADHAQGMAVWVNGRRVYREPERNTGLAFYTGISRHELNHSNQASPSFDIELNPGWNRLTLKLSTPNKQGYTDLCCSLRIMDPPDVPYEDKNIVWMTELPARSTSTPIIVGDRLFLMAEPDELICLDKQSGRILWKAANNYFEALTAAERTSHPEIATRVEPLIAQLEKEGDRVRRIDLRGTIQRTLMEIDEAKFKIEPDGHFEGHFGIVGFTMPTPVSDGQLVYVWSGMGVAACYNLDGQRKWITRVPTGPLSYGSSPALADGVLAVFLNQLYGLDAGTGKVLWNQTRINRNIAAVQAVRLAGREVFVTQQGKVVQPQDGKLLFRSRDLGSGDTGWSPPVILGNTMYLPVYGVSQLNVFDFCDMSTEAWNPQLTKTIQLPDEINRASDGRWIDRWTAGSPLIWEGLAYQVDIYGNLYVADLETGQMLYRRDLQLPGLMHYNAVPVAASPTLMGKHLFVMDNQGTTLILEPGREFKLVARNEIATQIERSWPIPAQETLTYAPPITDGVHLFIRGERFLYCIGER